METKQLASIDCDRIPHLPSEFRDSSTFTVKRHLGKGRHAIDLSLVALAHSNLAQPMTGTQLYDSLKGADLADGNIMLYLEKHQDEARALWQKAQELSAGTCECLFFFGTTYACPHHGECVFCLTMFDEDVLWQRAVLGLEFPPGYQVLLLD